MNNKAMYVLLTVWLLVACAVVYAAVHFIRKFW